MGVEAGQPHVANDDDAERVFGVLERRGLRFAAFLSADVRLPVGTVVGTAGQHDLHDGGLLLLGFDVVVGGAGLGKCEVGMMKDETSPAQHSSFFIQPSAFTSSPSVISSNSESTFGYSASFRLSLAMRLS